MSSDIDESFQVSDSESEEIITATTLKCKTCEEIYDPSKVPQEFMVLEVCNSCGQRLKEKLKMLEVNDVNIHPLASTSGSENSDLFDKEVLAAADDIVDDELANRLPETSSAKSSDALDDEHLKSSSDKLDDEVSKGSSAKLDDEVSKSSSAKLDDEVLKGNSEKLKGGATDDDMTFDVMLSAVFSCGSKSGRVNIHGHEYEFSACGKFISGRGGGTTMIITEFSKSIPDLFGYYYYGGMHTRLYSCLAFTMLECGNLFMGVMETMCNKCRIDPVIYFADTKTCRIITDRMWRRQFKLNCLLNLTIDIAEAKR